MASVVVYGVVGGSSNNNRTNTCHVMGSSVEAVVGAGSSMYMALVVVNGVVGSSSNSTREYMALSGAAVVAVVRVWAPGSRPDDGAGIPFRGTAVDIRSTIVGWQT